MTFHIACTVLACVASGFTLGLMVGRAESAKAKRECAEWRAEALLHVGANIARGHACPYCHGEDDDAESN